MIKYETNSKLIKEGQIFVAIKGHTVDGHDFIEEAIKNGASKIICEKEISSTIPYEIVNDILIIGVVDVNGVIGKKVKFRKIDNKEYSIDDIRQTDDVTYEFVNDGNVLGIWKSIAFTYSDDIGEVIKDKKDDLFLQRLIFCKDGKLIEERINETMFNHLLWTKGKVIDNKYSMTSSKYEILKIQLLPLLINV